MKQVLILYASTHGHTAKIASRVADVLERSRTPAEVRQVDASREEVTRFARRVAELLPAAATVT